MSPLATVTRHVRQLHTKTGEARLIAIDSADEIGVLATAFNAMIESLDKQNLQLVGEIKERQMAQEALGLLSKKAQ